VHAFTTTAEFSAADIIYRRCGTRSIVGAASGLTAAPTGLRLIFLNVLTTIGLPGSGIFAAKFLFFVCMAGISLHTAVAWAIVFIVIQPVFFMRI